MARISTFNLLWWPWYKTQKVVVVYNVMLDVYGNMSNSWKKKEERQEEGVSKIY
jgi:hypothetical protein